MLIKQLNSLKTILKVLTRAHPTLQTKVVPIMHYDYIKTSKYFF